MEAVSFGQFLNASGEKKKRDGSFTGFSAEGV